MSNECDDKKDDASTPRTDAVHAKHADADYIDEVAELADIYALARQLERERKVWEAKFNAESDKHDETTARAMRAERAMRSAVARSAPHCENGTADICLASKADGVTCPDDSCDIDDGVRTAPQSARGLSRLELLHLIDWHETLARLADQSDDFNGAAFHQGRARELRATDRTISKSTTEK